MASQVPPVVTWSLLASGAWLVYASVRGLSPLAELQATLTGAAKPVPQPLGIGTPTIDPTQGVLAPGTDSLVSSNAALTDVLTGGPTDLVPIGQGSHKLAAQTAQAFTAWQSAFGQQIVVTDSYRPYQVQKHGYEMDPGRYASPDLSRHVKGQAVDVNLGALQADPGGNAINQANWQRLYASAVATGWCNPRGPYKGDHKEPWHFSNPGCG